MKLRNDRREERRREAVERNAAWSKLTPQQQLDSLASRRGESKRQVERIYRELTFKGLAGLKEAYREVEFDRALAQREAFAARRRPVSRNPVSRNPQKVVKHG